MDPKEEVEAAWTGLPRQQGDDDEQAGQECRWNELITMEDKIGGCCE